jgi:hypothetical protein
MRRILQEFGADLGNSVRLDQYYAMIGVETHQFGGRGNRNLTEPINHRAGDIIRACGPPPWPISSEFALDSPLE